MCFIFVIDVSHFCVGGNCILLKYVEMVNYLFYLLSFTFLSSSSLNCYMNNAAYIKPTTIEEPRLLLFLSQPAR
jgi:hypothetical protein